MCMYSARSDGIPNNFHYAHWATRVLGQVAILITESTSVLPNGRLTETDLGLYTDAQEKRFKQYISSLKKIDNFIFGIQLNHSGRKSWGRNKGHHKKYQLLAPSNLPFDNGWAEPNSMSKKDIRDIIKAFKNSAKRAIRAGVDLIEIHAAHGYLLHQFLSPISNFRQDDYGGTLENRSRLLIDIVKIIKKNIPQKTLLFVRLSCTEWGNKNINGFEIKEAILLSKILKKAGVDLVDCSAAGSIPITHPPLKQGYQLHLSSEIKKKANILTGGVGLLTEPQFCNQAIIQKKCDLVFLGRELLRNPFWPVHAANNFNEQSFIPKQYTRAF